MPVLPVSLPWHSFTRASPHLAPRSLQVPQFLLEQAIASGSGAACNIICTQPRRISAVGLATRVAAERGEQVGAAGRMRRLAALSALGCVGWSMSKQHTQRTCSRPCSSSKLPADPAGPCCAPLASTGGRHGGILGPPGLQAVGPHPPAVLHHRCGTAVARAGHLMAMFRMPAECCAHRPPQPHAHCCAACMAAALSMH